MSKDLEEQLKEMGPDCLAVVTRLRSARTVDPREGGPGLKSRSTVEWLVAASLLLALALTVIFLSPSPSQPPQPPQPPQLLFGAHEYRQSVSEMIASQKPDGSWQNDFLTRRNAEALARCDAPAARIAYKKAMRNLRSKGIL